MIAGSVDPNGNGASAIDEKSNRDANLLAVAPGSNFTAFRAPRARSTLRPTQLAIARPIDNGYKRHLRRYPSN
jgi:hypothetical protein